MKHYSSQTPQKLSYYSKHMTSCLNTSYWECLLNFLKSPERNFLRFLNSMETFLKHYVMQSPTGKKSITNFEKSLITKFAWGLNLTQIWWSQKIFDWSTRVGQPYDFLLNKLLLSFTFKNFVEMKFMFPLKIKQLLILLAVTNFCWF